MQPLTALFEFELATAGALYRSTQNQKSPLNHQQDNIIPRGKIWLRTLQIGLLFSSLGWGVSFIFTFSNWESASEQLFLMGAGRIEYNPLLDYWLKMTSAAFGCIGIGSALACFRPVFFQGLILLLGPFHLFVGSVLVASAVINQLNTESHPTFVADITFCFMTALLIIVPLTATFYRSRRQGERGMLVLTPETPS